MAEKKNVLITGASSGFGRLITETLAKKGHQVFASMRSVDSKNEGVAKELRDWASQNNFDLKVVEMDVTSDESVNNAVNQVLAEAEKIDVVVNNAGIGNFGVNESLNVDDTKKLFDVNVFGPQRVNRAVLPSMRKANSGLIIQISSVLGRTVLPTIGVYSATKHAVEALAESYHYELKSQGVDSVIVQPGGYPTDFMKNTMQPSNPERHKEYGEYVEKIQESFDGFMKMLEGSDAPNPQDIADAVDGLVDMPQGQRPLRTAVGAEKDGAMAINRVAEKVQSQMLEEFGMK